MVKRAKHFLYVTTIIMNILINYLSYSIKLKRKSRGIVWLSAGKQRKVGETEIVPYFTFNRDACNPESLLLTQKNSICLIAFLMFLSLFYVCDLPD